MAGKSTPSGINDMLLGGKTNLAGDRIAARLITSRYPAVAEMARAGHAFALATVRRAAALGIRRVIRAGYVTPLAARNVHNAAGPGCRVVYVTRGDQAAVTMAEFASGRNVAVARARVAHPEEVLKAPPVADMLAEKEPVALVTGMFYHHAAPPYCRAHMDTYSAALPPGSVVAVSLMAIPGEEDAAELGKLFGVRLYPQTAADVAGWADGMEITPLTPEITVPGTAFGVVAQVR